MDTEIENKKCPDIDVDGVIAGGKQYDLDITMPRDNRDVIYGIIKDWYKEPVKNAVVKLVEVGYEYGKKIRKPISHTFTDEDGEFVFGPLCPDKKYEINFWADRVKHVKICAKCDHEGECLAGKNEKCDCYLKENRSESESCCENIDSDLS